jgi:glycerol uptake facilitator-like aquaporin
MAKSTPNLPTQALMMEFVGTFFLVLIVAFTGNPLAIGVGLMALVYMGAAASGAHFNPAITLGLYLNGSIRKRTAVQYAAVQLAAAFVAAAVYFPAKVSAGGQPYLSSSFSPPSWS